MIPTVPSDSVIRQADELEPLHLKLKAEDLRKEKVGPPKVTSSGVLMTAGQQAMQKLVDEAFSKMGLSESDDVPNYRTRLSDKDRWAIPNLLNSVTEANFYNMVTRQAWGIREDIIRPQPNGDWQPVAFRFLEVIDERQNIPYLHMVVQWLDLNNETDIRYANGAPVSGPTVNVHNDNSGYKELADAIQSKDSSNDQLIGLLTKLIAERENSEPVVEAKVIGSGLGLRVVKL